MIVKLRSVLQIAKALGGKEHLVAIEDEATVQGLIRALAAKHGEPLKEQLLLRLDPMELVPHVKIYVNGRGLDFLDGLATGLREGDDVMIMPRVSGG